MNLLEDDTRLAEYLAPASKAIRRYAEDQCNKPAGKRLTKNEVLFLTGFACLRSAAFFIAALESADGVTDEEFHDLLDAELVKVRAWMAERNIGAKCQ